MLQNLLPSTKWFFLLCRSKNGKFKLNFRHLSHLSHRKPWHIGIFKFRLRWVVRKILQASCKETSLISYKTILYITYHSYWANLIAEWNYLSNLFKRGSKCMLSLKLRNQEQTFGTHPKIVVTNKIYVSHKHFTLWQRFKISVSYHYYLTASLAKQSTRTMHFMRIIFANRHWTLF